MVAAPCRYKPYHAGRTCITTELSTHCSDCTTFNYITSEHRSVCSDIGCNHAMEATSGANSLHSFMACLYLILAVSAVRTSPTCVLGGFKSQTRAVLRHVQMSRAHLRDMSRTVCDVQRVLQPLWPGSRVVQFGATTTGLALKRSDVDCFVFVPNRTNIHLDDPTLISKAKSELDNYPDLFKNIVLKPNIDVAVLSFDHVPTDTPVDLTVTSPITILDASVLAHLLSLEERILNMAIIVKYWSYVHGISGSVFSLPSYTMSLLVVFYLQQKNILPSIASLQEKAEPIIVDHWNTAFLLSEHHTENTESLYELLGGFFKYYSDFEFNDVISPYCGCVLKRDQIENFRDLPKELSSYENNVKMGFAEPFIFGPVNAQDIFELSMNAGRPWNNRTMLDNLIFHTKFAAETYETVGSDRFLLTILEPHNNENRDLLNPLWSQLKGIESCLQ